MNRRALLSSLASLTMVSGCIGDPDTAQTQTPTPSAHSTTTESTTPSSTTSTTQGVQRLTVGETATIGRGAVRLYDIEATRTIITLDGIHFGIVTKPDAQYLVVAMTTQDPVDGHMAARDATTLELDGVSYPVSEYRFHPAEGGGFNIAYRVPLQVSATAGHISWTNTEGATVAEWTVPSTVIQGLNNPPEFTVHSFSVPDEAASFEPFEIEITVENTGAGDGEFKALLGNSNATDSAPLAVRVSQGERKTVTNTEQIGGDAGETRTLYLDWGLERLEHTITITESTTTS